MKYILKLSCTTHMKAAS